MITNLLLMVFGSMLFYTLLFALSKRHSVSLLTFCIYYVFVWNVFPLEPYFFSAIVLLSVLLAFACSLPFEYSHKNKEKS